MIVSEFVVPASIFIHDCIRLISLVSSFVVHKSIWVELHITKIVNDASF